MSDQETVSPLTEGIILHIEGEEKVVTKKELWNNYRNQVVSAKFSKSMMGFPQEWLGRRYIDVVDPVMKKVAGTIQEWDFQDPTVCSILSNQNGIGKTYIATIIMKQFMWGEMLTELDSLLLGVMPYDILQEKLAKWVTERYIGTKFVSESDLLRSVQDSYKDAKVTEQEILDEYIDCDMLILDDAFSGKMSDFGRRIVLDILDKRSERYVKPTVITSNLLLSQIADTVDTRIADRLRGQQLHQIKDHVESWRGRK